MGGATNMPCSVGEDSSCNLQAVQVILLTPGTMNSYSVQLTVMNCFKRHQ